MWCCYGPAMHVSSMKELDGAVLKSDTLASARKETTKDILDTARTHR
jgi:hypothetical protein